MNDIAMREDFEKEFCEVVQAKDDQERWGQLLEKYRSRLNSMIGMRLSPRMRGRIDSSDVIQETFLEASARLDEYVEKPCVPFYVWLRGLAGQRLMIINRMHFGTKQRELDREQSLYAPPLPEASSIALAAQLIGKHPSPSTLAIQAEQQTKLRTALNDLDQ